MVSSQYRQSEAILIAPSLPARQYAAKITPRGGTGSRAAGRAAANYMRAYELSLKSENFSDLRIPVSALYLLAAPSTPSEAVDDVIEHARSGERQAHAEIKDKIDKIKTAKATAANIKPQCGSSKN